LSTTADHDELARFLQFSVLAGYVDGHLVLSLAKCELSLLDRNTLFRQLVLFFAPVERLPVNQESGSRDIAGYQRAEVDGGKVSEAQADVRDVLRFLYSSVVFGLLCFQAGLLDFGPLFLSQWTGNYGRRESRQYMTSSHPLRLLWEQFGHIMNTEGNIYADD
jgi:hypothetical protein